MKIACNFSAQVLAKNVNTSKDGKEYYNATIFIPSTGEAGAISISEDTYKSITPGEPYSFNAEYNDKYSSLRVIGIE